MADIFVSYKKEDVAAARAIVDHLRAEGRSVWWDEGITPVEAWDSAIEREIGAAKAVVVLWSPRSVASDWVRTEAHYAQQHGKLVPVMIEPCTLPIAFMLRQAVDLSGGIDRSAPAWRKLMAWLDPLIDGRRPGPDFSRSPIPTRPPGARSRLEEVARRWWVAAAIVMLVLLAALGAAWWIFGTPGKPDVVVSHFDIAGPRVPAQFASDLHDEMFAAFSESSRVGPREGDASRARSSYQLTGRVSAEGDRIAVYAKLFAPGLDAPVLTTRLERPVGQIRSAPLELGLALASIVRCVATASDSSGSSVTSLPEDALRSWARFCELNQVGDSDDDTNSIVTLLRGVVKAAPGFPNGWSNLGEALAATAIGNTAPDRGQAMREAVAAADRALSIDPTTAKAYVVKAWAALPFEAPPGPDLFPALRDFSNWQRFFDQALKVRPSDCGCEGIQYGFQLRALGRPSAALAYFRQDAMGQTSGWEADMAQADALGWLGRSDEARAILDRLAARWPDVGVIRAVRTEAALWRGDWPEAEALIAASHASAVTPALLRLVRAKAAHDGAGVAAAGRMFQALAAGPAANDAMVQGLALAGLPRDALDLSAELLRRQGARSLDLWYTPPFDGARRLPGFAALAERSGLTRYWREPGHAPDFCAAANPPPICATLARVSR